MGNLVSERSLLDYLYVLVKWRRLIAVSFVAVGLLAAGVSLVLPEKWTANTKLLPPAEEGDQLGLSMLLGSAVPAGLSGLVGATTPSDRLLTLLDSRHVLGAVVDSHDLMTLYDAPYRDLAIDMLNDRIDRRVEADGTLVIDVTASTPELAARLANDLAAELEPSFRNIYFNLGLTLTIEEDYQAAIDALRTYRELAPEAEGSHADDLLASLEASLSAQTE